MPNLQQGNELITIDVFDKVGLQEGQSVGDLGCGNLGYYAFSAAKVVGKSGLVYAVDILKPALDSVNIRIKHEGVENVKTVWSDLEMVGATKIPVNSLDVSFIHNVLFQSTKQDQIIKEAARLLKPGGKLMIVDWKKIGAPFGPPVAERPDPELIKKYAAAIGLRLDQEFEAGQFHFGLIFIK